MTKTVRRIDLCRIFFRSMFIQGTFTLRDKIGTGFGFALLPGIRRIARTREEVRELLEYHSAYFNTHPYLASIVLGCVLRLEETARVDPSLTRREIETVKNRLSGVLGSLGDRLFWKFLKPFASVSALIILMSDPTWNRTNISAALLTFLVLFNMVHIFYRWWGLSRGYRLGIAVNRCRIITRVERLNFLISRLTLVLLGILIIFDVKFTHADDFLGPLQFLTAGGVAFFFNYKHLPPALGILAGLFSAILLYFIV